MDFKVTNWFERNYKWLSALFISFITAYAIFYYTRLDDKSDTFVVALLYALLLFVAGIYFNYMSNTIESKIDERIDIYRNLEKVKSTLEYESTMEYLESVRSRIISFQIFTGRDKDHKDSNRRPYISDRGVRFKANELIVEEEYQTAYGDLKARLINIIQNYFNENGLSAKGRNISIDSISLFKPEIWCKENLAEYDKHGRRMIKYLYENLEIVREEIDALELIGQKVMRLYDQYLFRASENIRQIERIYRRKLNYKMLQQNELEENFRFVLERIYEVEDRLTTNIDEHDEKIEGYVSEINDILNVVIDIKWQIDSLKDT
jgi:hypothetical protein